MTRCILHFFLITECTAGVLAGIFGVATATTGGANGFSLAAVLGSQRSVRIGQQLAAGSALVAGSRKLVVGIKHRITLGAVAAGSVAGLGAGRCLIRNSDDGMADEGNGGLGSDPLLAAVTLHAVGQTVAGTASAVTCHSLLVMAGCGDRGLRDQKSITIQAENAFGQAVCRTCPSGRENFCVGMCTVSLHCHGVYGQQRKGHDHSHQCGDPTFVSHRTHLQCFLLANKSVSIFLSRSLPALH